MAKEQLVTADQVQQHSEAENCWVMIDGRCGTWPNSRLSTRAALPTIDWAANGCTEVILKHAGTAAYNEVHPPSLLNDHLTPSKRTGKLDTSTLPPSWPQQHQQQSLPAPSPSSPAAASTKPPLETLISSHDFEAVAARTLSKKTWAFFSSAATDLVTVKANRAVFDRAWWQPRVLRSVRDVNTRTRILGCESAVPFFCAPAAMARLAHPEGERAIAAACGRKGVIQCSPAATAAAAAAAAEAASQ
ncbi:uncharacterized protein K441DRAFT_701717 [Cenococcum geophilum 1.58]|uniref:Uncharacterized protein n=1 Tax=Cenococcum geophilum 1.58 TaxID=794803 RepID=A0ACC8EKL7_9PEZI|nr:hypothetical protein K441DRAFT_701717 [Cenococcum geophilum 1.58]